MRKTLRVKITTPGFVGLIERRKKAKPGSSSQPKFTMCFSFAMPLSFLRIRNAFQEHGWVLVSTLKLQRRRAPCSPPRDHPPGETACRQRGQGGS